MQIERTDLPCESVLKETSGCWSAKVLYLLIYMPIFKKNSLLAKHV
jgi:hypothetical protein